MTMNPAAIVALANGDLENFLVAATPGGIERQEAAGQAALVNSTNMPKEMYPSRESFEKVGFTFGEDADDIFVSASLPTGWTRQAAEHAMHSKILDEQGRHRVQVFYKAAFYDLRADATLLPRFYTRSIFPGSLGGGNIERGAVVSAVFDEETEIYRTPPCEVRDHTARKLRMEDASAWLTERYPEFEDPTAYW